MKKLLFICCLFLVGINHQVSASVGLGSEIIYGTTAPGVWDVCYKWVQDCSTTAAPATLSLEIGAPGCTASRTVVLYPLGNIPTVPSPYCANSSLTYCGGAGTATIYFLLR